MKKLSKLILILLPFIISNCGDTSLADEVSFGDMDGIYTGTVRLSTSSGVTEVEGDFQINASGSTGSIFFYSENGIERTINLNYEISNSSSIYMYVEDTYAGTNDLGTELFYVGNDDANFDGIYTHSDRRIILNLFTVASDGFRLIGWSFDMTKKS